LINCNSRSAGRVTSGGFGPTIGRPISMGYIDTVCSAIGTPVDLLVRDNRLAGLITGLPFVPHRYKK
jgi:aminomethyltransferase